MQHVTVVPLRDFYGLHQWFTNFFFGEPPTKKKKIPLIEKSKRGTHKCSENTFYYLCILVYK